MKSRPTTVVLSFDLRSSVLGNLVALSHFDLFRDVHTVELNSHPDLDRDSSAQFPLGQLGQLPAVREVRLTSREALPVFHVFPNMHTLRAHAFKFTPQKWMWPASVPLLDVTVSFQELVHFTTALIRRLYLYCYASSDHILDRLASTLQSTRPICLSCTFFRDMQSPGSLSNWAGLFQTVLCPQGRLRYFEVTFDCTCDNQCPLLWTVRPSTVNHLTRSHKDSPVRNGFSRPPAGPTATPASYVCDSTSESTGRQQLCDPNDL
ncbi:uncharacterized protein B0H18DRAFT_56965 [Fomitopsis serialis]|uniref:uncharacterized protein n=1 Tax=Fomitopsis serialis TaxID=139415 RepID=UPI002008157A|nr:uncharacterized protein B0H18DRAFT_56965 [Neoantrodia serialis]KAH9916884.1 hypothetical protein B0H18DRAFT_56965 [Neoantrodia serialis]